jgi:hypothetical protein
LPPPVEVVFAVEPPSHAPHASPKNKTGRERKRKVPVRMYGELLVDSGRGGKPGLGTPFEPSVLP